MSRPDGIKALATRKPSGSDCAAISDQWRRPGLPGYDTRHLDRPVGARGQFPAPVIDRPSERAHDALQGRRVLTALPPKSVERSAASPEDRPPYTRATNKLDHLAKKAAD